MRPSIFLALAIITSTALAGCMTYDPGYESVGPSGLFGEDAPLLDVVIDLAWGDTVSRTPVEVPAEASHIRLDISYEASDAAGFRISGLGACEWSAPELVHGEGALQLDCGELEAGPHELVVERSAGTVHVALSVLAEAP